MYMKLQSQKKTNLFNFAVGAFSLAVIIFLGSVNVFANHPVFVEGNCLNPPTGNSSAAAGVCGDYAGDGLIGTAEDNDGDRVFGTINGARNSMNGVGDNGTITIVTSGVFAESSITFRGNVTLQAAPGVEAIVDAVLQGDPGSGDRQNSTGIFIDAPANRRVVLRNIIIKNFAVGIFIVGNSTVTLENVRLENNVFFGIRASGNSVVNIFKSSITATGYRQNPGTGDFPTTSNPSPGYGTSFESTAKGNIVSSTISNNFGVAISNSSSGTVCTSQNNIVGNRGFSNGGGSVTTSAVGCYQ